MYVSVTTDPGGMTPDSESTRRCPFLSTWPACSDEDLDVKTFHLSTRSWPAFISDLDVQARPPLWRTRTSCFDDFFSDPRKKVRNPNGFCELTCLSKRFASGRHSDVEPVSTAVTFRRIESARLLRMNTSAPSSRSGRTVSDDSNPCSNSTMRQSPGLSLSHRK